MDGIAISPSINTALQLNKADSSVPITFEPLKPSVNCICLQAEVYTRLFAKSELICVDNSNILQAPGRHEGLLPVLPASPTWPHKSLHSSRHLHTAHAPKHSARLTRKDKKQGAGTDTKASYNCGSAASPLCTPAKSPDHVKPLFSPIILKHGIPVFGGLFTYQIRPHEGTISGKW